MKAVCGLGLGIVLLCGLCSGQEHDVLCKAGSGAFEYQFHNELNVWVGGEKEGGFNARTCRARLRWGKQTEDVAHGAAQIDIDLLGGELSAGEPVVAFSIKQQDGDCCLRYKIYSLGRLPKSVRDISGGGYFSAADTDLDGDIEIWTDDSAAIQGLDGLALAEIEFLPTYVLRIDKGRLVDASHEFQNYYDSVNREVRSQADANLMRLFKNSDGRLGPKAGASAEEMISLHRLRKTKVQVLEMVWAYLYGGREQEAWRSLAEMWPESDFERIRKEIVEVRDRGIRSQLDGTSNANLRKKRKAPIYEQSDVTVPQAIMMRIYPPRELENANLGSREVHVSLVIDAAGKVRSVKPLGVTEKVEGLAVDASGKIEGAETGGEIQKLQELVDASVPQWKFVPAFKNRRPVASQVKTGVWLQR